MAERELRVFSLEDYPTGVFCMHCLKEFQEGDLLEAIPFEQLPASIACGLPDRVIEDAKTGAPIRVLMCPTCGAIEA